MTFKTTKLRDAISFALVVGTTAIAGTGVAAAQTIPSAQTEATTLDRIEVTGSRIRSVDAETSQPVLVLDRAAIEKQGLTSVAEVLQRISANGANINRTFNNGGDGSSEISLRNLGSSRTLVLVDGRRWVQGLGGAVDLNTIPSAMVERIEVLKDGASSIYGSDAIAGVVNIITRQNYEGAEARAYVGQFSEGDGERTAIEATLGAGTDTSNVVISLSRVEEQEVSAGDRTISATPTFGRGALGFSGFGADGRIWNAGPNPALNNTSTVVRPGSTGTGPADDPRYALNQFQPRVATDGYNFAADNYLLTPQTRTSLYLKGRQDITDSISFVADALYNERRSEQQLAGFPLNGGVSNPNRMSGDSFYNPYNTIYGGDGRTVAYSRRLVEQPRVYQQNVKTFHVYAGFEGSFAVGERFFDWDFGYNFNKSDQEDAQIGDVNVLNQTAGTGPSELRNGQVVCVDAPGGNVIGGCVPFNPLSPRGGVTQEMLDFLLFTAQDAFQGRTESFTANIAGDLFELPGGMMGFAAGVESRKESGFDRPDAFVAAGFTSGNSRQPTSGSYDLDEVFAELLIPVLADVPGAQLLELSLASRYSDYSNFGDTVNSKFGFKWKPIDSLLVRGNYAEGFRAPPILSLFRGTADSFIQFGDPCSTDAANPFRVAARANCAAQGIPANFVQQTNGGAGYFGQTLYPFQLGGNQNLGPETSISKTLGVVFSPSFVEGLNISLDWWNIEITDAIGTLSTAFIVEGCYLDNDQSLCNLITRRPEDNQIGNVGLTPQNLSVIDVEGYDFNVSYRMPETQYGAFGFTLDTSYTSKFDTQTTAASEVESAVGQQFQNDPNWRIRANASMDWSLGDFGATWSSRYYSGLVESCGFGALCSDPDRRTAEGARPRNRLPATTYHDVQGRYNTPWNAVVKLGVNNLFEKDPPVAYTAFANSFDPQYDVPGRYLYMEYVQRF